jgi:hypothetical protein
METEMTSTALKSDIWPETSQFTGSYEVDLFGPSRPRVRRAPPLEGKKGETARSVIFENIAFGLSDSLRIFEAINQLYISKNRPRDLHIAERVTALHRIVLAEGDKILPSSLEQFAKFFVNNPNLGLPKIFVTPNGTMRARWISSPDNFVAIEFLEGMSIKLVAEVPRGHGKTSAYFASETMERVVSTVTEIGGSVG